MYIVSACLLGRNCKYDGGNNENRQVIEFCRNHKYLAVCPEVAGKLSTPRIPAEIREKRVVDREGKDLTENFLTGARISMEEAVKEAERYGEPIEGAILKSKSPSCGFGKIYDGTFTATLTEGKGIFAELVESRGIPVMTEKEFE